MKMLIEKLYNKKKSHLIQDILHSYEYSSAVSISFLNFRKICTHQLFDKGTTRNKLQEKKALLKIDYLVPYGISLQILYAFLEMVQRVKDFRKAIKKGYKIGKEKIHILKQEGKKKSEEKRNSIIKNIDEIGFVMSFLEYMRKKNGPQSLCISLYGGSSVELQESIEFLKYQGYNIVYSQNGKDDLERKEMMEVLQEYQDTINILLVGPLQKVTLSEVWMTKNAARIKNNHLMVLHIDRLLTENLIKKSFIEQSKQYLREVYSFFVMLWYMLKYGVSS